MVGFYNFLILAIVLCIIWPMQIFASLLIILGLFLLFPKVYVEKLNTYLLPKER